MSQVFIHCPNTGKPVYIGLNMEWNQLESYEPHRDDMILQKCHQCGKDHVFEKSDMFVRTDGGG